MATTKHTLVALVEDKPGVLNRTASLFRRRSFNIDSIAVGHSELPHLSRMTIVVNGATTMVEQVRNPLRWLAQAGMLAADSLEDRSMPRKYPSRVMRDMRTSSYITRETSSIRTSSTITRRMSSIRTSSTIWELCCRNKEERMFDRLQKINRRPEPFERYTRLELWNDEHITKGMLEAHLDPNTDAASRNKMFMDKSIDWIVSHFKINNTSAIIDFGCGPGMYTTRFAEWGRNGVGPR